MPTLMSAVGEATPGRIDGVDGMPMLRGQQAGVRDHCIVEYAGPPVDTSVKTVVTPGHKLSWYRGRDYGELYDLEQDPREKTNLWDDPACAAVKARLLCRILENLDALERRPKRISAGA